MLFANFIQLLHKLIEPSTSRSNFTENTLKQIITNEEILKYSDSSYNNFYDGKIEGSGKNKKIVGDTIDKLAETILHYLDAKKFEQYLNKFQFNNRAKTELCDSFKKEVPDINTGNYAEKLSKLLEVIIINTAEKSNGTQSIQNTSNHTIKMRHAIEIENIIKEIIDLIEDMPYWYEGENRKISFQEKYKNYHRLNRELCAYGIIYEFIDELKQLPKFMLKEEDFFMFNESHPYLGKFNDYKLHLVKIRKELLNYHEE